MSTEMKKIMATSQNGYEVYVVVDNAHMMAHDVEEDHLAEAIKQVTVKPPFGFYTVDFGKVVGKTACVKTTEQDDIRMECRPGRELPSRVVYNREAEDTSLLTVGICTDDDGLETVFTSFYGELAPKELNDPRLNDEERPEAEAFWATHALIVG